MESVNTMTTTSDLLAWLGDAAEDMTPEQLDTFTRLAQEANKYDPEDEQTDIQLVLSAAHQYAMGVLSLDEEATKLAQAIDNLEAQRTITYAAIKFSITEGGITEYRAEKVTGISRPTIRKIMGRS